MPQLYTYTITTDDGAAPNPYWGICTLAICKPAIRRTAKVGDWVVGIGSKNSPLGDLSYHVVYAMKVTEVMLMKEYDMATRTGSLKKKIPVWGSSKLELRLGDSIYDFSGCHPRMRQSVHFSSNNSDHTSRDISGVNVLLSKHFYYFGNQAIQLPQCLHRIRHPTQGHKSKANKGMLAPFIDWINEQNLQPNVLIGTPINNPFTSKKRAVGVGCDRFEIRDCRPCSSVKKSIKSKKVIKAKRFC